MNDEQRITALGIDEAPDLEQIIEWEDEGFCEAACSEGCRVEPDGTCSHGHKSWMLILGLI